MHVEPDKLIRSAEVKSMLGGISDTTLWRRIKDGSIPKPIKIGTGSANFFRQSWIYKIIDFNVE